jgi:hypothetical protein
LLAGLAFVAFVNGISGIAIVSVSENGIAAALLSTFDISVIVWSACAISVSFLLREPSVPVERSDWIIAACVLAAVLVPVGQLSWLALVGLAVYILRGSPRTSYLRRGAWIILTMTVPMFWGRQLITLLSDPILQADAMLIGWLVGMKSVGNTVQLADGSGYLWIAPRCSSLANISLAALCWVTVSQVLDHPGSVCDLGWVLLTSAAVVAINVTRISLIGLYPEQYELIHGPVGAAVASWAILGVTLGGCLLGVRHELASRA